MSDNLILNWNQPEEAERVELVFEGRFKAYGAYMIRKRYSQTKLLATFITCLLTVGSAYSAYWYFRLHPVAATITNRPPVVITETVNVVKAEKEPPIIHKESNTPKAQQNVRQELFVSPLIDPKSLDVFKTIDEIFNPSSADNPDGGLPWSEKIPWGNKDIGEDPGDDYEQETVMDKVSVEAKYTGGEEAFIEFVKNNFVYPPACLEEGIMANMELQFVINRSGRVSGIRVVKGCKECPALEAEAIRVLSLTDRNWIPAFDKGKPVVAYRKVPIIVNIGR